MAALSQAERRWWLVPALLLAAALAVRTIAFAGANADYVYRQQVEMFQSLPAEQRGPVTEMPPPSAPHPLTVALPMAGRLVGSVVTWLIWAGLIALSSTFLGHNGARFGALFAMVVWARLPIAVRYLVQGISMGITGNPIYNEGLSGLAVDSAPRSMARAAQAYVPPARGALVLGGILGRIDIYMVWALVLTGLGIWAFAHVPRRRAMLVAVGIWVVATAASLLPIIVGIGQGLRIF